MLSGSFKKAVTKSTCSFCFIRNSPLDKNCCKRRLFIQNRILQLIRSAAHYFFIIVRKIVCYSYFCVFLTMRYKIRDYTIRRYFSSGKKESLFACSQCRTKYCAKKFFFYNLLSAFCLDHILCVNSNSMYRNETPVLPWFSNFCRQILRCCNSGNNTHFPPV